MAAVMSNTLESLVVFHCAPVLAGIKPSNIFTWHPSVTEDTEDGIYQLKSILAQYGVSVECLCSCDRYALIMLCRKELLFKVFSPDAVRFLEKYGYPPEESIDEKLSRLKGRFKKCGTFPHEIGVFLGYPLEDVAGFIDNRGCGYKLCGDWKVYGDEKRSMALFERYRKCAEQFGRRFAAGCHIPQLMDMAQAF